MKTRLREYLPAFTSASIILMLILAVLYPAILIQAKLQRQNEVHVQLEQVARYFDQSVVRIVESLIDMESLPRDCSQYVQEKFRTHHFWLPQVGELSLFDPQGNLVCSSWQSVTNAYSISKDSGENRISVRAPIADSMNVQSGILIGRRARDGYENTAFLPLSSLRDYLASLDIDYTSLSILDAKTGVPVVVNGSYSLPIEPEPIVFPLRQVFQEEGIGDNLERQYWYVRPLVTLPQLALEIGVPVDHLYAGIYVPSWHWWFFLVLFHLSLTSFLVYLRHRAKDPKRNLLLALKYNQLFNVYQPIVDACTGELLGVEVLMRWQHPQAGLINPAEFIPMAERTGLIVPMTVNQIDAAAEELKPLLRQYPSLYLSFNIGAQHLLSSHFISNLLEYKKVLGGLNVEITESELMEHHDPVIQTSLELLQEHQIHIAIDDFGTGYSSLGYLQGMSVSALKIDRSFVAAIGTGAVNAPVLEAIIHLSQNLEMQVIAEGVETMAQSEWLVRHGVYRHQGWLYAKAEKAEALLRLHWPIDLNNKTH